jgi:hypothetical protein
MSLLGRRTSTAERLLTTKLGLHAAAGDIFEQTRIFT